MIRKQAAEIVMGLFVLLMFVLMFASPYGAIVSAAGFGVFILLIFFAELGEEDDEEEAEEKEKKVRGCRETGRYTRYIGREKDRIEMKEIIADKTETSGTASDNKISRKSA